MKYILLAYTNTADWASVDYSSPEFAAMCKFYEELGAELTESGELVTTMGLADPSLTRTVRKTASGPVASDGPYAEVKEVLASFSVVDVDSHDRAMAIAARVADNIGDTIEVRPLPDGPPADL
ncbi:YciI family protein [Nocardia sp. NBC_00511]|uniref:YciI family protein n=1 Tax=Nocardia sp. NBC_00511 TaxID=2903591 RepID=UPI0030E147F0